MPASKKRIQRGAGSAMPSQVVPAALRDWVHTWHGVQVRARQEPVNGDDAASITSGSAIFHSGSRMEELSFWKQIVRLPSNSLFSTSLRTIANPRRRYKDFLYVLLNMRWPTLISVLLLYFVFNIIAFAVATYVVCGNPDSLLHSFNLSYQTFSTIGFGIVYPSTTCSNVVMVVESFASMLITSAITGLVFAKFAKPKAKIAFSKVCVVQPYGKKYLALVVRVANATQSKDVTHDVIMETNFKLNLLRIERRDTFPGQQRNVLCSYFLKLLQNNFITFRMGIAVVHVIDESSPLFGLNEGDIAASDMILEVSMSGVDSTLQDTVSERYTYTAEDFKWGYRFAELLDFDEKNSEVIMDFGKLSTIERAVIDDALYMPSAFVAPTRAASIRRPMMARGSDLLRGINRRRDHPLKPGPARDAEATGSLTSQGSTSSMELEKDLLQQHDKLSPDDLPETMLHVERQTSEVPAIDAVGGGVTSPRLPRKFSLGMEPLFEPLLQAAVGTQRITNQDRSTENTGGTLKRTARLLSGSTVNNGEDDFPTPEVAGLPKQQQQQLQDGLAGDLQMDIDDSCFDEEEDGDDIERRRLQWRTRSHIGNLSAVSIDVQDTPRFLKISPMNIPKSYDFMRLYNSALYQRWPRIILVFVLAFLVINASFALLYSFKSSDVVPYSDLNLGTYEQSFFMSVHTLATIGYGSISPDPSSVYMNLVVLVEAALGIIVTTIITGIAWSKFARPRAHIHFSSHIVITHIYGRRCLVFRAANTRHSGDVHENFFRIGVILTNRKTGLRQLYDVPLVTAEWPSIKLPATLIHIIDETSPFFKFASPETLLESRVSVIVLLTGLDTTFSENVYARKMYFWDDFAWNMRFADFAVLTRDHVEVDFVKFDQLLPAEEGGVTQYPVVPEGDEDVASDGDDDGDDDEDQEQKGCYVAAV